MTQSNWQQNMWHGDDSANRQAVPQGQPAQQPAGSQSQQPAQPVQPQPRQQAWQPPQPAAQPTAQQAQQAPAQQPGYQAAYAQQAPAYAAGYVVPPAPAPKKSRGWIVALVAVILFFLLMFAGLASCTSVMSSSMGSLASFGSIVEEDATYGDTVAIIEISGTIQYDGTTCSPEGLKAQLDEAEANPDIKAVVLRVNSGGGTATAGEEMATYVREFSKPVVVSSASTNASAAYEISSQADYIFTAKTTSIGSIGTVIQVTDLSGLYEKLGISVDNITSSDSKDSAYGNRALTEEERAYYQDMVDQINETFIETVAAGRGMTTDEVRALATGLTFTGMTAVENGLADEIGTLEDAILKACELAGIDSCDTIYLDTEYYDLYSLLGMSTQESASAFAAALIEELEDYVGSER